tara:strand:- start:240 stop:389 length:150 start_codon:yes stop_codon:yes gene_type:complete
VPALKTLATADYRVDFLCMNQIHSFMDYYEKHFSGQAIFIGIKLAADHA